MGKSCSIVQGPATFLPPGSFPRSPLSTGLAVPQGPPAWPLCHSRGPKHVRPKGLHFLGGIRGTFQSTLQASRQQGLTLTSWRPSESVPSMGQWNWGPPGRLGPSWELWVALGRALDEILAHRACYLHWFILGAGQGSLTENEVRPRRQLTGFAH